MSEHQVEVRDQPERERYEVTFDGKLAGFAQYVRRGGRTLFVHTEVFPDFGGHGLGSTLAGEAVAAERAAHRKIVPLCSFIRSYVDRHPDEMDLVDHDLLHRIDEG